MATFKKFEDIKAWQKARRLTNRIYNVTGRLQTQDSRFETIKSAALSPLRMQSGMPSPV